MFRLDDIGMVRFKKIAISLGATKMHKVRMHYVSVGSFGYFREVDYVSAPIIITNLLPFKVYKSARSGSLSCAVIYSSKISRL
jgi:hypothetical protein